MRIRAALIWISVALGTLLLCAEPAQACADHAEARAVVHSHTHSHGGVTHSHAHSHQEAPARSPRSDRAGQSRDELGAVHDDHHCCESGHSHGLPRHVAAVHGSSPKPKAPAGDVAPAVNPMPDPPARAGLLQVRIPAAIGPPHLFALRTIVLRT